MRQRNPAADLRQRRSALVSTANGSSRTSSDEPPPISNRMTPSASGSTSGVQPVAASAASVSRSMISSVDARPARCTRARKSSAVLGRRGRLRWRSAATRVTPRLRILSRQTSSASTARSIAASLRRPELDNALAQPDDAGEGVDDAEAVLPAGARPAGGNCWCRDRARHRSARRPIGRRSRHARRPWRPPNPAGARLSCTRSSAMVEAWDRPRPRRSSCHASSSAAAHGSALPGPQSRHVSQVAAKCNSARAMAQPSPPGAIAL